MEWALGIGGTMAFGPTDKYTQHLIARFGQGIQEDVYKNLSLPTPQYMGKVDVDYGKYTQFEALGTMAYTLISTTHEWPSSYSLVLGSVTMNWTIEFEDDEYYYVKVVLENTTSISSVCRPPGKQGYAQDSQYKKEVAPSLEETAEALGVCIPLKQTYTWTQKVCKNPQD